MSCRGVPYASFLYCSPVGIFLDTNMAAHICLVRGAFIVAFWRASHYIEVCFCLLSVSFSPHLESSGGSYTALSIISMVFVEIFAAWEGYLISVASVGNSM